MESRSVLQVRRRNAVIISRIINKGSGRTIKQLVQIKVKDLILNPVKMATVRAMVKGKNQDSRINRDSPAALAAQTKGRDLIRAPA